jgi:hypothetical protein
MPNLGFKSSEKGEMNMQGSSRDTQGHKNALGSVDFTRLAQGSDLEPNRWGELYCRETHRAREKGSEAHQGRIGKEAEQEHHHRSTATGEGDRHR